MPYTPPTSLELTESIDHLQDEYKNGQLDRHDLIKVIISFEKINDHTLLLGACCYGLESIGAEYKHISPDKADNDYRLFGKLFGSDLYGLLKNALKISAANPLDLQQRLIYLTSFLQYLDSQPVKDSELIKKVDIIIQSLVNRQRVKINELLSAQPMNSVLMKNFYKIPHEYKTNGGKSIFSYFGFGKTDPEHVCFIQFILLIKSIFDKHNPALYNLIFAYDVIYGALIYFMEKIEDKYKIRAAENSDLYKQCQRVSNLPNSQAVSSIVKSRCYANLNAFIENHRVELRWDEKQWGSITEFLTTLQEKIVCKIPDDGMIYAYLAMIAATATQCGVKLVIGNASTGFTLGGTLATLSKIINPEYALIMTLLIPLLHECVSANVITKVASKITPLTFEVMKLPVVVTYKSAEMLSEFCNKLINYNGDILAAHSSAEWIQALMSLPPHLFSAEDHAKLANVVDVEELNGLTKQEKFRHLQTITFG